MVILGVGLVFCAVALLVGRSVYSRVSESRATSAMTFATVTFTQVITTPAVRVTRAAPTRTDILSGAPTATSTATAPAAASPTLTALATAATLQSATATPTVTFTALVATPTSTVTPTPVPTGTLSPSPSPSPSLSPAYTPSPSPTPVVPTQAPTETPTATPTEITLAPGWYVQNHTDFTGGGGDVHVIGEVLNNTGDNQENVELVVSFYDGTGQKVGEVIAPPVIEVLPQGVTVPFEAVLTRPSIGHTSYDIAASGYATSLEPRRDLEVLTHSSSGGDPYRIVGEIGNRGAALRDVDPYVQIIVTLYQSDGTVAGLGFDFIAGEDLGPGQMTTFEVAIDDPLPGVVRYALVTLGF